MIQSRYILDILDLTFDQMESEDLLRKQIPFLTEKERNHTGVGLYIYFLGEKGIENFKIPSEVALNFDIKGNQADLLIGVEVKNEKLNVLADATVHLSNGLIHSIEIWNKNGEEYPSEELYSYELTQSWLNNSQRRTIKR